MLNRIISFSLKNHLLVAMASLAIAFYGAWVSYTMPVDVLPDLNRPIVTIMTEAHAMVPEDVERLITIPLEQVLNGATGVSRVRSASGLGVSIVFVEFNWDTDIYKNRQIVQEKLQLARSKLPTEVIPQMAPISSIMGQIQLVGVQSRSGKTDASELRALVDYQIKYRLLALAGVSKVIVTGGAPRQLQVIVDAEKLRLHKVTLPEVTEAIEASNMNASGGLLVTGTKGPSITVTGLLKNEEELLDAVVRFDPLRPVKIADVARVEFGPASIQVGEAGVNAKTGVILVVMKQPETDTMTLTKKINEELKTLQASLPNDIVIIPNVFQQAKFIERAIDNVFEAVRDGGILVVLVLFVFLLNFRITFITLTAIPLSIAITAIIFDFFGLSINTMTLGGLAVAIGALVDDAIVDVENVYRRLKENSLRKKPYPSIWVIFRASSEVRKPILIGTLLVMVVYLPLFFLTGLEGRLFVPIGLAYILSVGASLIVALTVTPILCLYLLSHTKGSREQTDTWTVRKLKAIAAKMISFSIQHHVFVLGGFCALLVLSIFLLFTRGTQFLPPFNEGVAQINMYLPPEISLETSDQFGKRMEVLLSEVEGVQNVGRRTGRSENDEHAHGVNVSEGIVTFDPNSNLSREEVIQEIRRRLAKEFPGIPTEVDQPLSHLLSHMLSGVKAQVAIQIFGQDLDVLRRLAKKVEGAVRPVEGVVDLFTEQQVLVDHIVINPKRKKLFQLGLTVEDVSELVVLALEGEQISRMQLGAFSYPVIIRLEEKDRQNLEKISNLVVGKEAGSQVLLKDVAQIRVEKTPNNINRQNVSRLIVVQHNISGRSLGEVIADVQQALIPIRKELSQYPGYSIQIGGQYEAQVAATKRIFLLSFASLAIMVLVLFAHFRSFNLCAQVLMSIPMAFVGAVTFIVLSEQVISVATLVGLISLGGIASRNSILLLDRYLYLMREEKQGFTPAMIIRAGEERMVPVLMTALTSGIALIPIALAPNEPGREILYPVATVIVGGLISCTLLDFLVRPALFWMFGQKTAEVLASQEEVFDRATEEMYVGFEVDQEPDEFIEH